MLAWPLKVVAFDATVAQTDVGAEHQVVCFFAVAAHFLGVRARNACLDGGKFRRTSLVTPKCTAHTEIVITTHRKLLIIRSGVSVVGAIFQDRRPLVAVVSHQTLVAIHYACHCRVKVQRALIELRKVDVLGLCHCREHHEAQC